MKNLKIIFCVAIICLMPNIISAQALPSRIDGKDSLYWSKGFLDSTGNPYGFAHTDGVIHQIPANTSGTPVNPATSDNQINRTQQTKITDGIDDADVHDSDDIPLASVKGLTVFTEERAAYNGLREGVTIIASLVDSNGSGDMNVDVGFSGTPEVVYDGGDTAAWTASAISGTWDFTSTTHAKQGKITVIQYSNLSGAIITVQGTNITNTVLTEGVDWTAATSNNATASSIQSAVDGVAGVSATVTGAVVEVIADNSTTQADITTLSTDAAGGDMTATAQSVEAIAVTNGDEALLESASTTDMGDYSAITFDVYLTKWSILKSNSVTIRARLDGVDVGSEAELSDFINVSELNYWQRVSIVKSELGITSQTIDEFVIEISATVGEPNAPDFYIDCLQIEETGGSHTFAWEPPSGTMFYFQRQEVTFQVTSTDTVLDPNRFLDRPRLDIGVVSRITKDGATVVSNVVRENLDFIGLGTTLPIEFYTTGSVFYGKAVFNAGDGSPYGAVIFRSSAGDKLEISVNDDLSPGLANPITKLGINLIGRLHAELP